MDSWMIRAAVSLSNRLSRRMRSPGGSAPTPALWDRLSSRSLVLWDRLSNRSSASAQAFSRSPGISPGGKSAPARDRLETRSPAALQPSTLDLRPSTRNSALCTLHSALSRDSSFGRARWATGVALVAALLTVAGCTTLPPDAAKQVKQGRAALDAGRYDESDAVFSKVIAKHAKNPGSAEAFYCRGLARLQLRRTDDARRDMEAAARLAQDKQLKALADAQLGNLDFDLGRYADAVRHYRAARPHLPYAQPTDRVWYQYGIALQRTGETSEARQVFDDLPRFYPGSPYAKAARTASAGRTADTGVLRTLNGATTYPGSATTAGSGGFSLVAPTGSSGGLPAVASASSAYSIQCGSYNSRSLAEQAADNIRIRGLNAQAFPDPRGGGRYVVRVGSYGSQHEAMSDLPRIRRVQQDAFVVSR